MNYHDNSSMSSSSMSSSSSSNTCSMSSSSSGGFSSSSSSDDDYEMVQAHFFGPVPPPTIVDHRTFRRSPRKIYDHARAFYCIEQDYLGNNTTIPLFDGREFEQMFRISRARFQRLRMDIGASGDPFYVHLPVDTNGRVGASLDARLLLPIKSLAYGVPPHTFRDYFQMSTTLARDCYSNYNKIIIKIYKKEYLRLPTPADVKAIFQLHEHIHKIKGMMGSLDGMHTFWKNCPVAWQGDFNGAKGKPSIVLEAACDHHLWFWHTSYGYAGTMNDINIMNISHLQQGFLNGTFSKIESQSGVMPYIISQEKFMEMFYLVDGIYPRYSRFVKAVRQPILYEECKFTNFQEAARKDIERAFGVFQGMWQCAARPIYIMNQQHISEMITCVLILHNMCVSDRVMDGNVYARYVPTNSFDSPAAASSDIGRPGYDEDDDDSFLPIGIANAPIDVQRLLSRSERWQELQSLENYSRLNNAIINKFKE